jgi:hypothetical protein
MTIDSSLRAQLDALFQRLNTTAAARSFPRSAALSAALRRLIPQGDTLDRNLDATVASYFASAAVEIWLRSVHSFLVSTSLTQASPIWSSVSGYYSSHYAVRGLAHLLGYFQLFQDKRVVQLRVREGRYVCTFNAKKSGDAEHKLYWKLVKQSPLFSSDVFFSENDPNSDASDIRHRNHADYADHIALYPTFNPLEKSALKSRIQYISKIVFDAPPLPRFSNFPDLENVQLIAYHKIVRFRRLLDEALGGKNRFWTVHRSPAFANEYIDFQLAESAGLPLLPSN